jgi:hypothetical protein
VALSARELQIEAEPEAQGELVGHLPVIVYPGREVGRR